MMQVILNNKSCGGAAHEKWARVSKSLKLNNGSTEIFQVGSNGSSKEFIADSLNKGRINFVIAGGDGTINHFLNDIINLAEPEILSELKIGAVGIGSSNDFHKPFQSRITLNRIPYKLNFIDALHRDIGCLQFENEGKPSKKYFLINASIGITAEGNNFFNNPDSILRFLKKYNTQSAITYAALKNIFTYKNFIAEIRSNNKIFGTSISNLGIIKCPFFSGKLRYQSTPLLNNGLFDIHLYQSLKKWRLLDLFYSLGNGINDNSFNKKFWRTNGLKVTSQKEFAVEFDGEVITTKSVEFSVIPRLIKVCIN
jgi:diacylglycerol kinase family enzyme